MFISVFYFLYQLCDSSVELMYSCEKSDVLYERQIDWVSHSEAVMSHSLSADGTARSGHATIHGCCGEQHAAVTCLDCNIVVLAATAWVESCRSQWWRVVAVVECQAAERDDCRSPRLTRCHHQPQTSAKASRHQWMIWVAVRWRPLHSPTHMMRHTHKHIALTVKIQFKTHKSSRNE